LREIPHQCISKGRPSNEEKEKTLAERIAEKSASKWKTEPNLTEVF